MADLLTGAPAAAMVKQRVAQMMDENGLREHPPVLEIIRVGEAEDDLTYERSAVKRMEQLGIGVKITALADEGTEKTTEAVRFAVERANTDSEVSGVLFLMATEYAKIAREILDPAKDIDGCTAGSMAGVYAGTELGFAPCTAQACIEILDHYGIEIAGKRAVVIGRSTVIGRPVAMMLMHRNATVTVCHTKTADPASIARGADIVIACCGRARNVGADYAAPGQTIIDVGINWDENLGRIVGDVDFDAVEPIVGAITPVPKGVGAVTTSVLALHTVQAALRQRR
jgi:methylenetetrahydrofolate dehydrogenase (NADP+) / methenyltetrahydrofolate cyclohydrolase